MFARDILKMSQIESALGTRVAVELPYDPYIYLKAVNEGVPVVLGRRARRPRSGCRGSPRSRSTWITRRPRRSSPTRRAGASGA